MATPNIRSYYDGDRSRTEVDGSFPVIQPMTARDQLMALMDQESTKLVPGLQAPRGAASKTPLARAKTARPQMRVGSNSERQTVDPLAARKAQDQYEMQMQAAAMRPVGLGPQMIPGMAVDPRFLPPSLRPGQSNFQNLAGPSQAGITESPAMPQRPSSNAGFDYLPAQEQERLKSQSAYEQARWLAAMGRTR